MTTSPLFYETLQFSEELPEDPLYGPDVVLQVWDADRMGTNTHMALLRMPMSELEEVIFRSGKAAEPTWRLVGCLRRALRRRVVVLRARIRKHSTKEKTARPEPITPAMRQAWVRSRSSV